VLRAENQNTTHVTPLIASIANGYFVEELQVIGRAPDPEVDDERVQRQVRRLLKRRWLEDRDVEVEWNRDNLVRLRSKYMKNVKIHYKKDGKIIANDEEETYCSVQYSVSHHGLLISQ
jgi:DNA (cytosine-5)-methyltransferase 1